MSVTKSWNQLECMAIPQKPGMLKSFDSILWLLVESALENRKKPFESSTHIFLILDVTSEKLLLEFHSWVCCRFRPLRLFPLLFFLFCQFATFMCYDYAICEHFNIFSHERLTTFSVWRRREKATWSRRHKSPLTPMKERNFMKQKD